MGGRPVSSLPVSWDTKRNEFCILTPALCKRENAETTLLTEFGEISQTNI